MIKDLTCNSTKNRDVKRIKWQKELERGELFILKAILKRQEKHYLAVTDRYL